MYFGLKHEMVSQEMRIVLAGDDAGHGLGAGGQPMSLRWRFGDGDDGAVAI